MRNFEELLFSYVGEFGWFQLLLLLAAGAPGFQVGLDFMEIIFLLQVPEHWCKLENQGLNESGKITPFPHGEIEGFISNQVNTTYGFSMEDKCRIFTHKDTNRTDWSRNDTGHVFEPCSVWQYDESVTGHTLVSHWNLVCDRAWLQVLTKSIMLIGQLFGVAIGGTLSDRYGRQRIGRCFLGVTLLMRLVMSFSPYLEIYLTARFVNGASNLITYTSFFVLCSETLTPVKRPHAVTVTTCGYVFGCMAAPLTAWLLPKWSHMSLANTIIVNLVCVPVLVLPESPRWLVCMGKSKRAQETLTWMAKLNRNNIPDGSSVEGLNLHDNVREPGCLFFMRSPLVVVQLAVLVLLWLCGSMIYYGLALNVGNLEGNLYVNTLVLSAIDLPGYSSVLFIVNSRLGRRLTIFLGFLICSISLLLDIVVVSHTSVHIILALIGKLSTVIIFGSLYVLTPEMFPTGMRSTTLGLVSAMARVGSSISPFILHFQGFVPAITFGLLATLAMISVLALPETRGKPFPSTIEDMANQKGLFHSCLARRK